MPKPGGLILLSPALDWAQTHIGPKSAITQNARDCIVNDIFTSDYTRRALVGNLPEDFAASSTWISPGALHAEWKSGMFSGFPPTVFVVGGVECSLDAMHQARDRLIEDNGKEHVKFLEYPDALHDFLMFGVFHEPERTEALKELGTWVETL